MQKFIDLQDAGERLYQELQEFRQHPESTILGVLNGGVVLGDILARKLGLPLEPFMEREIGHPANPFFPIGVVNPFVGSVWHFIGVPLHHIREEMEKKKKEMHQEFEKVMGCSPSDLKGRVVLLVDDGSSSRHKLSRSVKLLKKGDVAQIVLVTPMLAEADQIYFNRVTDRVIYLEKHQQEVPWEVYYETPPRVSRGDVMDLLKSRSA